MLKDSHFNINYDFSFHIIYLISVKTYKHFSVRLLRETLKQKINWLFFFSKCITEEFF